MRLRFGHFSFDAARRELSRGGEPRPLTPKAFALLRLLIERAPDPLSRAELQQALWPDSFVEEGNLHNLVSEIRAAFGDDARELIRTVHRFGYAFTGNASGDVRASYAILFAGEEHPLREGENFIGRDSRCTVVLHAPEVSRQHARLIVGHDGVTMEDLSSKNGTFVDGVRVEGLSRIGCGAEIVICTFRMRLLSAESQPSTVTAG